MNVGFMAKTEQLAVAAISGGGFTIAANFNDWSHEYAPSITFLLGLVAMLTGVGTLAYKFWDGYNRKQQRINDRKLAREKMRHEKQMAKVNHENDQLD